jgi:hypothetical protein
MSVIAIVLVAVEDTGYADDTADGFLIYWDDLTVQYSACPPPGGWGAGCIWRSNSHLLAARLIGRLWQTR